MNRKKKICVVTGSRAEYDLLYPLIDEIDRTDSIELDIIVTGSHLSNEFGSTYKRIEEDGFIISRKVEVLVSSSSQLAISLDGDINKYIRVYKDVNVSKSIGIGIIGFSEAYSDLKPDLIVLLGDRFEIFAAASAATVQKIPIAHIHGGEVTKGSFDESFRHSITKMSHLHFTSIEEYRNRVIQLGEDPDSVFSFGAIGLDNIQENLLLSRTAFEKCIGLKLNKKNLLISFHEATLEKESTTIQFQNLLDALDNLKDTHFIFTKSNADPAGKMINKLIEKYVSSNSHKAIMFTSMGRSLFLSAMKNVNGVVGNSSSGLIEAPSIGVGTINIGNRQGGRTSASSVIHCEPNVKGITKAFSVLYSHSYQKKLSEVINPYQGKNVAKKILKVIKSVDLEGILLKKFYDIKN